MNLPRLVLLASLVPTISGAWAEEAVVSGRLRAVVTSADKTTMPLGGILVFASSAGEGRNTAAFRTWETEPAGWYRLVSDTGDHTILFTQPAHFMRPVLHRTRFPAVGQHLDADVECRADCAVICESSWDREPAAAYYQPFVARGTSITQVGFKLAHDGVDGFGPGAQDLLLSIHGCSGDDPAHWPQIGPTRPVLGVDCGGGKNRAWSAGWHSGQVPVKPGGRYAVRIGTRDERGSFQAFWQPCDDTASYCWRRSVAAAWERTPQQLWLSVASDADGLLVPYNKCVHREYGSFAGFARTWSQTYVAQGQALAGVVLYAACGGTQPPLTSQRVAVRVRRGGPTGPVVGASKVAAGAGNYTGDASWGVFGAAFAPDELPLEPGTTYAIEFETLETPESLRGFVNVKGQVSDERPGFNPYRKQEADGYEGGMAYREGAATDCDLDMQIVEYAKMRVKE